jgi:hypothetical protein
MENVMPRGVYDRDIDLVAKAKRRDYRIRAIESYQPMLDALHLARPIVASAGDYQAIAAIDKALAAAKRPVLHDPSDDDGVDDAGQSPSK